MCRIFKEKYEKMQERLVTLLEKQIPKVNDAISRCEVLEREVLALKENDDKQVNVDRLDTLKKQVKTNKDDLAKEFGCVQNQINELKLQCDDTEQFLRQKNIKVTGLPETEKESIAETFVNFTRERLKLTNVSPNDIEHISRMGKSDTNKTRDVLVMFKTRALRDAVYQRKKILYNKNERKSPSGIYLSEDLTPYRQRLFYDARQIRKQGRIWAVWTSFGRLLVRIKETDNPQHIRNHKDLADLLRDN